MHSSVGRNQRIVLRSGNNLIYHTIFYSEKKIIKTNKANLIGKSLIGVDIGAPKSTIGHEKILEICPKLKVPLNHMPAYVLEIRFKILWEQQLLS